MQTREKNPNWRGGRSIASNGYVIIRVGVGHHLADVRGYAYEHRLVAEQKLGRRLEPGEIVHHKDENKQDNTPDNLEVVKGNAEHFVLHRKRIDLRMPGEDNPTIQCACGCGASLLKYDQSRRPRSYVTGHNPQPEKADSLRAMLLWYLENVPQPGTVEFISSMIDVEEKKIRAAFYGLRDAGKVHQAGREWRLGNAA